MVQRGGMPCTSGYDKQQAATAFGEPCVPRDSSADDLICAAVLAADLSGVSSSGRWML